MKAKWNGKVIAESNNTIQVEGNHYFPHNTIKAEYFKESKSTSVCPWKGTASYYTISVDGVDNVDAAWFYPTPKDAAAQIKDFVAFWKGVEVTE
jgi:uncharacterized protein (DUF427 family)